VTTPAPTADRMLMTDLVGRPWAPDFNCYHCAREVLARMDIEIPEHQADALAGEGTRWQRRLAKERVARGDVLVMLNDDGSQHVGVMIDGYRFMHCVRDAGVRVDPVGPFIAGERVLWVARFVRTAVEVQ